MLNALSQKLTQHSVSEGRKKGGLARAWLWLFCADQGMFGGACTGCFHSDRPHSLCAVSCTGNSSAGEAFADCCGSTIITAGSGPCHITQQYKFDLDQVWAHDYISVKLAEHSVRILCRLSAFILVAEEMHWAGTTEQWGRVGNWYLLQHLSSWGKGSLPEFCWNKLNWQSTFQLEQHLVSRTHGSVKLAAEVSNMFNIQLNIGLSFSHKISPEQS